MLRWVQRPERTDRPRAAPRGQESPGGRPSGIVPPGGHPLEPGTRLHFEWRFGRSFDSVRIHTETVAADRAASLNAAAYTVGEHLVFGAGHYRPQSLAGRRLLAHELAHVVQQREAGGPPVVRRWVTVQNPGATPTHGSFAGLTRGAIFADWLNTMCPTGMFRVDPANGEVNVDRQSICFARVFDRPRAAQEPRQASCNCACDAWDDLSGRTDLYIDSQIPLPARSHVSSPDRSLTPFGGAVTITPTSAQAATFVVSRPTIIMTGTGNVALAGAGDPHSTTAGMVSTPPWLVFAHEYCGHVHDRPNSPSEHLQTPEGTRSAVDVENLIRREHGFGTRRGAYISGGQRASVWRLQPGDTLASLETRFGVVLRGSAAWDLSGDPVFPRNLSAVIAGEIGLTDRADLPAQNRDAFLDQVSAGMLAHARQNEGSEIVIAGIAWDDVRPGDTWASIATRWGVAARGGATGAQRVERANQGLPGLVPGGRVVIPR
jgi:hypothetical protein